MKTPLARLSSLALAVGCSLAPALAAAGSDADKAAADALFEQGRALIAEGKYAEACPKFEESRRLDPGLGTSLNLADCYEHTGRLASAWGLFNATAREAEKRGDTNRAEEAGRRAALLAPRLAKLAIVVPPATRVPGLEVRKDGEVVGEGQFGAALPADAGQHTIEAAAPKHKPWSTVVRIETDGSSASVEIPALADAPAEAPSGGQAAAPFEWTGQRIGGAAVAGAGVLTLAAGATLGGLAIGKYHASEAGCVSGHTNVCPSAEVSLRKTAGTLADASTGTLIAGGAVLVAGAVVFLTGGRGASAPKAGNLRWIEASPLAGGGTAGLLVRGGW
jgi:hypothetical protein